MILGIVGVILFVALFIAAVMLAILLYPRRMAQGKGLSLLYSGRFLFSRFKPVCYWYSAILLIRNSLICFSLLVFDVRGTLSLHAIFCVLLLSGFLQAFHNPWRFPAANCSEVLLTFLQIVLLLILLPRKAVADFGRYQQDTLIVGTGILVCLMIAVLGGVLFGATRAVFMKYHKPNDVFLSHHKGGAAVTARLLKTIMSPSLSNNVFLDSDDLQDLDSLFEVVRSKTLVLAIILTSETLRRPWCAGEIVTAFKNGVKITLIAARYYTGLDDMLIDSIPSIWTHEEFEPLLAAGITLQAVTESYTYLLDLPRIRLPSKISSLEDKASLLETTEKLFKEIHEAYKLSCLPSAFRMKTKHAMLGHFSSSDELHNVPVIVVNSEDFEASASAILLETIIGQRSQVVCDTLFNVDDVKRPEAYSSNSMMVLLSKQCLESPQFFTLLHKAIDVINPDCKVPCVVSMEFQFPSRVELQGISSKISPEVAMEEATIMNSYIALLKVLAIPVFSHLSIKTIQAQVSLIEKRLNALALSQSHSIKRHGTSMNKVKKGRSTAIKETASSLFSHARTIVCFNRMGATMSSTPSDNDIPHASEEVLRSSVPASGRMSMASLDSELGSVSHGSHVRQLGSCVPSEGGLRWVEDDPDISNSQPLERNANEVTSNQNEAADGAWEDSVPSEPGPLVLPTSMASASSSVEITGASICTSEPQAPAIYYIGDEAGDADQKFSL
jgi:hypothetical protein